MSQIKSNKVIIVGIIVSLLLVICILIGIIIGLNIGNRQQTNTLDNNEIVDANETDAVEPKKNDEDAEITVEATEKIKNDETKRIEDKTEVDEIVIKSQVGLDDVMMYFWESPKTSASHLNGYHATSVAEVVGNWKRAFMQKDSQGVVHGNGALLYALCSPEKRELCYDDIMNSIGHWNFYYAAELETSDQGLVPDEMIFSKPERQVDDETIMYFVDVTETYGEEVIKYTLNIEYIDGGYYIAGTTDFAARRAHFIKG